MRALHFGGCQPHVHDVKRQDPAGARRPIDQARAAHAAVGRRAEGIVVGHQPTEVVRQVLGGRQVAARCGRRRSGQRGGQRQPFAQHAAGRRAARAGGSRRRTRSRAGRGMPRSTCSSWRVPCETKVASISAPGQHDVPIEAGCAAAQISAMALRRVFHHHELTSRPRWPRGKRCGGWSPDR